MIVAFTKDWNDVPTCTTHVLREMGKSMPVLWIESIGTRKPQLHNPGDLRRVIQKLMTSMSRAVQKENHVRVLSPTVVPNARSRVASRLNRFLLGKSISREMRSMAGDEHDSAVEYWCFVPNAVDFLPVSSSTQGRAKVIYYCVDDWSRFAGLDTEWLAAKEEELLIRADVVFTPAKNLEKKCRAIAGDRVHCISHGVAYDKFSQALQDNAGIPSGMAGIDNPIIGFYGNIYPWIDFDLLYELANSRPDWSFVMIGERFCDVTRFDRLLNVHFTGRREHQDLPGYCKCFDVAIIPYDASNPRMTTVNPVKTKELLAAGVPIAASDIPELRGLGDDVLTCSGVDSWLEAIELQMRRTDQESISARMKGEDWSEKVKKMRAIVDSQGSEKNAE